MALEKENATGIRKAEQRRHPGLDYVPEPMDGHLTGMQGP
jgi:hypothetical protein